MPDPTAPFTPVTSATSAASAVTRGTSVAESETARGRRARAALRALQVVLALFFAFASAFPKLIGHSSAAEIFQEMGWGSAGMYAVGALELAGAVGLVLPLVQSAAAIGLSGLMVGAFVVQLTVFDGEQAATPVILLVPLTLIAWARRRQNKQLLRVVRRRG
ncbi:DoxX family protein [Streptomyces cadmiisoli]|uniref:DoxX family protein n=1 Tax=Streptomyces cadmiisoli TaxID=2184053 RepID=UPI003D751686